MRISRRLLSPALLLGLLFCTGVQAQELRKIYVNPKNPAVQKQSEFIDSIRFIPFEYLKDVNVENAFARPTENYFFITDFQRKALYFYSKTGVFVRKVDFSSLGDRLYPTYRANKDQIVFFGDNPNYTLTSKDRIKILLDWSNQQMC